MELDQSRLDSLIEEWLRTKYLHSKSQRTVQAYHETLLHFRYDLERAGLSLLSPMQDVSRAALIWLDHPQRQGMREVAAGTFNQRRAILSSFYRYTILHESYHENNPMERIPRRHDQPKPDPDPLTIQRMRYRLQRIERKTPLGRRDYALIELGVMSGKRDHELRSLNLGDLTLREDGILLTWQHMKGGKTEQRLYEFPHAASLLDYILHQFGSDWASYPTHAVFVSLAYNGRHDEIEGPRLTRSGIVHIYEQRLGTTKVHSTRRLFAQILIEIGASAPTVQQLMNHASLATTQRYFAKHEGITNPYAGAMHALLQEGEPES